MEKLQFNNSSEMLSYLLENKFNEENVHTPAEALLKLIRGDEFDNLSNLCRIMKENRQLFKEDVIDDKELLDDEKYYYNMLQQRDDYQEEILKIAFECLARGQHLGTKTINGGKINTSSWYSHSLYVSEVCANLARQMGLNENVARTLGIMHDYGRKYEHSFKHVIIGAELLKDINWKEEAKCCVTHSFVNGGRCANNEQAVPGFYVDEFGNPQWRTSTEFDDITIFLNKYSYTDYDRILNIADLMATDKGILSPYDRIQDIATRRTIDPTNRGYFLAVVNNLLLGFLEKINDYNYHQEGARYIKASKDIALEDINKNFYLTSLIFFDEYRKNVALNRETNYLKGAKTKSLGKLN